MIGFTTRTVGTLGRKYKAVDELLLLVDTGGNAAVSCPHLCSTSSEMLQASLRRSISSTRRDGPEITVESDDRRKLRKRMPPRRRDDGVSMFELPKYGDAMVPLPMVRSRPFLVPPLYPPAAVTFLFEFDALVGARWKYLQRVVVIQHEHRQTIASKVHRSQRS